MKRLIIVSLLVAGMVFPAIVQQGGLVRVKEQLAITMTATAVQETRNVAGYVALISGSSYVANFVGTDNVMAPISSGITDTEWWFNTDDEIYVTGSGQLHVIVYDHWTGL